MNKRIYSLVWNNALRQVVVASEFASKKSAGSPSGTARGPISRRVQLATAMLLALGPGSLMAQANAMANAEVVVDSSNRHHDAKSDGDNQTKDRAVSLTLNSRYYTYAEMMNPHLTAASPSSTCAGIAGESAGYGALACGYDAVASGSYSTAIGMRSVASGEYGSAFGYFARAEGYGSTAMGWRANSKGDSALAMGAFSNAVGTSATAVGSSANAQGNWSVALGSYTSATGEGSIAAGEGFAQGSNSIALGTVAFAGAGDSIAIGRDSTAQASKSIAMGYVANTGVFGGSKNAIAIGDSIDLNGDGLIESNEQTFTAGDYAIAFGASAQAAQINATAIGTQAIASGKSAV